MVTAGVPHDVGDKLGIFFAVERDRVRHLILLIVTDRGLYVQFESSTRRELWTMLQFLHCIQRCGDDAGWRWSSLFIDIAVYTLDVVNSPNAVNRIFEKTLTGEFS